MNEEETLLIEEVEEAVSEMMIMDGMPELFKKILWKKQFGKYWGL